MEVFGVLDTAWTEQGRIGASSRSPNPMINRVMGEFVTLLCAPWVQRLVVFSRGGLGDISLLAADPRIRGLSLTARYATYVDPRALVLDVRAVEDAGPMEMFRALFQSAAVFHRLGRRFERVVLARSGTPVFVMEGSVYARIGADFAADLDPAPLLGTIPPGGTQPTLHFRMATPEFPQPASYADVSLSILGNVTLQGGALLWFMPGLAREGRGWVLGAPDP
jgi:hypothetical protein